MKTFAVVLLVAVTCSASDSLVENVVPETEQPLVEPHMSLLQWRTTALCKFVVGKASQSHIKYFTGISKKEKEVANRCKTMCHAVRRQVTGHKSLPFFKLRRKVWYKRCRKRCRKTGKRMQRISKKTGTKCLVDRICSKKKGKGCFSKRSSRRSSRTSRRRRRSSRRRRRRSSRRRRRRRSSRRRRRRRSGEASLVQNTAKFKKFGFAKLFKHHHKVVSKHVSRVQHRSL